LQSDTLELSIVGFSDTRIPLLSLQSRF
jgi:hypothetical protein